MYMQVFRYACMQVFTYMQVCNNVSMNVCKYECLYKKLNKKRDRARPYPRLRDFFYKKPTLGAEAHPILTGSYTKNLASEDMDGPFLSFY